MEQRPMTEVPELLAPVAEVAEAIRAARAEGGTTAQVERRVAKALKAFEPALDALADADALAAWLGVKRESIYREQSRSLADDTPSWPEPDFKAGRSKAWTYRTIALYRASMPGRGSAGRGRPRRVPAGES
jgi:hypothetical protein